MQGGAPHHPGQLLDVQVFAVVGFPLVRAERLGGSRLAVDQQGVLHLRLLSPGSYLVVPMTNGACPGGQRSRDYFCRGGFGPAVGETRPAWEAAMTRWTRSRPPSLASSPAPRAFAVAGLIARRPATLPLD